MTTTTSYSKKDRFFGLYKSTLKRSAGYGAMFSALIFIFYPLQYILQITEGRKQMALAAAGRPLKAFIELFGIAENFTGVSAVFVTILLALAPIIFALLLNSYMQSHKAADVYHALPVTRGMMMTANAAVAMTIIAVPMLVSDIIIAVVQTASFGFSAWMLGALVLDTLGWLIMAFAVYALVSAVSTGTGTTFDALIHSVALLFALPALAGMFLLLAEMYLTGWSMRAMQTFDICMLSPVMVMPARMMLKDMSYDPLGVQMLMHSSIAIWVYLLLGVGLLTLGVWLYRRRHTEMAETTNSKGPLKNSVKLLGVMVCGIMSGMLFGMLTGGQTGYIIWAVIGGMMTYAILEAILNRGFKTLIKSLPLGILMTALAVGSGLIMMNGGLGYETRIPATNDVASVEISYKGRFDSDVRIWNGEGGAAEPGAVTLSDPPNIQAVTEFHRAVVGEMANTPEGRANIYNSRSIGVSVTYQLKNGRQMSRRYSASPEAAANLIPLEVSPEFLGQTHPAFFTTGAQVDDWDFTDALGRKSISRKFTAAESGELLAAIKADISAQTLEDIKNPKPGIYALVNFDVLQPQYDLGKEAEYEASMEQLLADSADGRFAYSGSFPISDKSQASYKWLEARGLISELETPIEDCVGVAAAATLEPYNYSNRQIEIVMTVSGAAGDAAMVRDKVGYGSLEEVKRTSADAKAYRLERADIYGADLPYFSETAKTVDSDSDDEVFEAPAEIKSLSEAIVHTIVLGKPYIRAQFYFENGVGQRTVLLDPRLLPQSILDKFVVVNDLTEQVNQNTVVVSAVPEG